VSYPTNQNVGQDCGEVVKKEAMKGGKVVSWEVERWVVGNSNPLNENNYQIITNYSTAVEDFSLKVFTEENNRWAGRRVKVEEME